MPDLAITECGSFFQRFYEYYGQFNRMAIFDAPGPLRQSVPLPASTAATCPPDTKGLLSADYDTATSARVCENVTREMRGF